MKKLSNRKGFTLLSLMVYIMMFLVISVISFNLVRTVSANNLLSTEKIKFANEKTQIYTIIEKHSSGIVDGTLKSESIKLPKPLNESNESDLYKDSLSYTTSSIVEENGVLITKNVKVQLTETDEGFKYIFTEETKMPDGTVKTGEEQEMVFGTITDVKFDIINKICTDDNIDTGCLDVKGLVDIAIYNEKDLMGRLALNKSKRSFFFETK